MKKLLVVILLSMFLVGCSAGDFEQVSDVYAPGADPVMQKIHFSMPAEASQATVQSDFGSLYFCDGYEIMVQTFLGGDIRNTIKELTGFDMEALTVIGSEYGGLKRYDCAWTAAGEMGASVGRTVVFDDGAYHYCVSLMANENEAGALQETWQTLISSVTVQS